MLEFERIDLKELMLIKTKSHVGVLFAIDIPFLM